MIRLEQFGENPSIIDVECPQCGRIAKLLDNFTGIEETVCPICGYSEIKDLNREKTTIRTGYGTVYIEYQNCKPFYLQLNTEPTDKKIKDYLRLFEDTTIIKEKSYFYLFKDGTLEILKGTVPRTFDDYLQELEYEKYLALERIITGNEVIF